MNKTYCRLWCFARVEAAADRIGKLHNIVDLTFRITNCRFPTRDCIPYVRSGLSQLVIRVIGFHVSPLHCVRANNLDFAFAFEVLSFWRRHHVSESRVL